ncbi:MAG: cyanoexosortase B system-associated protein, partial [Cyanobacteria bacterium J06649_4]
MSSSTLPSKITRKKTVTLIVIAALAVFIAVSALPRYVSSWPWATPLKVPNQSELQAIRDQGLTLEGWQTDEQVRTKIGGDAWSIQQLSPLVDKADSTPIFLLLRPQVWE